MALHYGVKLSAQLAWALALSAAALPPGQVQWACAHLPTATHLLVVEVEATGRRRPWKAGRRVAPTQKATAAPSAPVLVAGRRGADRALQRGGAARRGAGAAVVVVVWGTGQTADTRPEGCMLAWGAVMYGGATGTVHQLSDAWKEVRVTVAASPDAVAPES